MITKYEEQMYNDIHRIADALEKLAKHFTEANKIEVKEMTDEEKQKYLNDSKLHTTHTKIITSPYIFPASCEDCWWYQQQKANPNPTITIGDTPCTWCPKMQPTCVSSNKTE